MIACAIGHTTPDFDSERMTSILTGFLQVMGCKYVISGNWPGVDRCLAEAALRAKIPYMITESHIVGRGQMDVKETQHVMRLEEQADSFLRLGIWKEQKTVDAGNAYRIRHSDAVLCFVLQDGDAARVVNAAGKPRVDLRPMYWPGMK